MTINPFNRRAALRIAGVSLLLAALASPLAWFVARESAEETTVALAAEESRRLLQHYAAFGPQDKSTDEHALAAAQAIVGGLFDIAEIYDAAGNKRAEAMTASGAAIETLLPPHQKPKGDAPDYLSMHRPDRRRSERSATMTDKGGEGRQARHSSAGAAGWVTWKSRRTADCPDGPVVYRVGAALSQP